MSRSSQARDGFALIASLFLVVAMSAVALHVGAQARTIRLRAATTSELTRAEAAALAGLEHTRARLQPEAWKNLGRVMTDTFDFANGAHYTVRLYDTGSRLNLNHASEEELRRLLRALRIEFGEADRLAQRIADWRDPDDFERARGAEREQYLKLDMIEPPANRPFASVDDLRAVVGMTESIVERIAPYLTVDGGGLISLNTASEPVLLALPGITPEAARAILRMQLSREAPKSLDDIANGLSQGAREELRAAIPQLRLRTTLATSEIIAESTGWSDGSPVKALARGLFACGGTTTFFVQRSVQ
ncbi:MAG: general secretion pathway protein GspK [Gemmatimonadota bacterium]